MGVHCLLRDAIRVVPGLEETEFIEATCGARPGTPDDVPYLGQVGENLIVSTGCFRHGILLAALGARTAVNLATGQMSHQLSQPAIHSGTPTAAFMPDAKLVHRSLLVQLEEKPHDYFSR